MKKWTDIPLDVPIYIFPKYPPYVPEQGYVGVDFEGSPASMIQIAFENCILIAKIDDPFANGILKNTNYIHGIFGEHERKLVARPFDVQQVFTTARPPATKPRWSLADVTNMLELPGTGKRYKKNPSIHRWLPWHKPDKLPQWAFQYAAIDAEMTRRAVVTLYDNFELK